MQALDIAVQKQPHEAAQSIVQMLGQGIEPAAQAGSSKGSDIRV